MSKGLTKKDTQGIKLSRETTYDRIFAWYYDSEKYALSDKEHEIRDRWRKAWNIYAEGRTRKWIVAVLTSEHGISEAQAYRDIANSIDLFGDIQKNSKQGERAVLTEMCRNIYTNAMKSKDYAAANRAIDLIARINRLDAEEDDLTNPDKLEASDIQLKIPRDVLKQLKAAFSHGYLDLDNIQDVPFEEVKDGEGEDA